MRDSGDGISVSLEDIALQMRAIAGRLSDFPNAGTVGISEGPSGGASHSFRTGLRQAGAQLTYLTTALTTQLAGLEAAITTTGNELVAADQAVAYDVGALEQILATVAEPPASTGTPSAPTTPSSTGSTDPKYG